MKMQKTSRGALVAALAAATLMTAGCATETSYRPATGSGFARTGYSDHQIEGNRFEVAFSGNSYTSRDTVEKYLLFRAAELTVQHGADYFILADRQVDRRSRTFSTGGFGGGYGGFGGLYGGWGPSWRYHGGGFGWRSWSPWGGDPFFGDNIDIQTIDKFEATAEIIIGKGPKPANNVRAFDARDVMAHIGPSIVMPK